MKFIVSSTYVNPFCSDDSNDLVSDEEEYDSMEEALLRCNLLESPRIKSKSIYVKMNLEEYQQLKKEFA